MVWIELELLAMDPTGTNSLVALLNSKWVGPTDKSPSWGERREQGFHATYHLGHEPRRDPPL